MKIHLLYENPPAVDINEFSQQSDKQHKLNSSVIEGQVQLKAGQLINIEGIIR